MVTIVPGIGMDFLGGCCEEDMFSVCFQTLSVICLHECLVSSIILSYYSPSILLLLYLSCPNACMHYILITTDNIHAFKLNW